MFIILDRVWNEIKPIIPVCWPIVPFYLERQIGAYIPFSETRALIASREYAEKLIKYGEKEIKKIKKY